MERLFLLLNKWSPIDEEDDLKYPWTGGRGGGGVGYFAYKSQWLDLHWTLANSVADPEIFLTAASVPQIRKYELRIRASELITDPAGSGSYLAIT